MNRPELFMLVSAASQKLDLRVRRRSERRVPAFCACAAAARLPEILHDFLGTASGPAIGGPLSAASGFSTSEAPPPRDSRSPSRARSRAERNDAAAHFWRVHQPLSQQAL